MLVNANTSATVARARPAARGRGFSLVELMVALAIGGIIMALLGLIFYSGTVARKETEKSSRQIENGRYAMETLGNDLAHAGYFAEFDPTALATPASKPDPCEVAIANIRPALAVSIQGVDNVTSGTTPSCISDVKNGTDVVVIRRVSTCIPGGTCDAAVAVMPYFQASLCGSNTELLSATIADYYVFDAYPSSNPNGTFTKHKRNCTTFADVHLLHTQIYFVANNDNAGDGIPTLKRADFAIVGGALAFKIVPVAEGIDNLQVEYGIDTDGDGAPNAFTADPDSYNGCAGAACVTNLRNVVSVRVNLLARNTDATAGWSDDRVYTLGLKADGSANNFPSSGSGYADAYKRHAYTSQIRLVNPASRRLVP